MFCKGSCDTTFLNTPLSDCKIAAEEDTFSAIGIARAWVPMQPSGGILYSSCEGLRQGTIYPILDQPYECPTERRCCENG